MESPTSRPPLSRLCSKVGCSAPATWTLTYVYDDAMAVVGPLSPRPEPHSHDLCERHAERLSAPNGWSIVRYSQPETDAPAAS